MQHACIKLQKTKICLQCRCFVDTWAELEETSGTDIPFLEAQQVHSQYFQLARHSVSWLHEEKWRNSRWTSQNNTSALLYVSIKQSRLKILRYSPLFILRLKICTWLNYSKHARHNMSYAVLCIYITDMASPMPFFV